MIAAPRPSSSTPTLREHLREAPFSLAMSSGFFGFFAHCGFLSALEDEGLVPQRITGASAGALIGALFSAGLDTARIERELAYLRREEFWDPAPGAGLLAGERFRAKLTALLPVRTFEACRIPLAVSAFDVLARRTTVIERGGLTDAIAASCAVPLLFQPVTIGGRFLLDGGIRDRPGLEGMPANERVLFHHLASRSPWRSHASMRVPTRASMVTVAIERLPRVGPFRLEEGVKALSRARNATLAALDAPVVAVMRA